MKKENVLISVLLAALIVAGWASALTGNDAKKSEYDAYIEKAEEYVERKLYQKAIEEYKNAIGVIDSKEDRENIFEVYELLYAENSDIFDDYLVYAEETVTYYPDNADFLSRTAELYIEMEEYKSCYKMLEQALEEGMENEEIEELFLEVKYSYELGWKTYSDYREQVNGYYIVLEDDLWSYIEETGEETSWQDLSYAGEIGDSEIKLINSEDDFILIDGNEVIQGRVCFTPEESGIYANELIPIKSNGKYAFYNSLGDKSFGEYEDASSFEDEKAAVKDGNWYLIDVSGEKVGKESYEEIVLGINNVPFVDGVMIAKQDGKYQLFDNEEKKIGSFSCSDIDCIVDSGWIAFCEDGKWGYVDQNGKIMMKPQYANAKSFSNGLAAVSNGEKWGFIDTNGNVVIDYVFEDAGYFNSTGSCMVKTENQQWCFLTLNIW